MFITHDYESTTFLLAAEHHGMDDHVLYEQVYCFHITIDEQLHFRVLTARNLNRESMVFQCWDHLEILFNTVSLEYFQHLLLFASKVHCKSEDDANLREQSPTFWRMHHHRDKFK